LIVQTAAGAALINVEQLDAVEQIAGASTPEHTVACLDAILVCRKALEANVGALLAMESLLISLSGIA